MIPFFKEIGELKGLLKSLQSNIKILTGNDIHTLIAARKDRSVASVVVKNNQLCATYENTSSSGGQRCGSRGCLTCPTIVQDNEGLCVNRRIFSPGIQLNCKSSNVIYLAQCTICDPVQDNGDINCYAGQTIQPLHKIIIGSGHVLMSMRISKSGKNQHCPSMPMGLTKITSI